MLANALLQDSEFGRSDRLGRWLRRRRSVRVGRFPIAGGQFDMELTRFVRRCPLRRCLFFEGAPFQISPLRFHVGKFTPIRRNGTHQC